MTNDPATTARLSEAVQRAWEEGCPVAAGGAAEAQQEARVVLKRWNSFARRRRNGSIEQKVEDLAKGLRDAYEESPELVGPLMTDYRYLAAILAEVLIAEEKEAGVSAMG